MYLFMYLFILLSFAVSFTSFVNNVSLLVKMYKLVISTRVANTLINMHVYTHTYPVKICLSIHISICLIVSDYLSVCQSFYPSSQTATKCIDARSKVS